MLKNVDLENFRSESFSIRTSCIESSRFRARVAKGRPDFQDRISRGKLRVQNRISNYVIWGGGGGGGGLGLDYG